MMSPDEVISHGSWQPISLHPELQIYVTKINSIKALLLIKLVHDQWFCGALLCATTSLFCFLTDRIP